MKYLQEIEKEVPKDDSTSEGERMLLYWLVRELKPKVCVETGTHRGLSTLYMAHALYDNGGGIIYTADPNPEWNPTGNFRKFPELEGHIKPHNERGDEMEVEEDAVDFFFFDGLHELEELTSELVHFYPKFHKGTVAVFHDCKKDNKLVGVNEAVKQFGLGTVALETHNSIRIYSAYDPS